MATKQKGCSQSCVAAFCILNSVIVCSCPVLQRALILTDESSGGQKAAENREAVAFVC